jgi:hypothetical protein
MLNGLQKYCVHNSINIESQSTAVSGALVKFQHENAQWKYWVIFITCHTDRPRTDSFFEYRAGLRPGENWISTVC